MIKIYTSNKFKQTGLWASFIVKSETKIVLNLKVISRMLQDHCQKYPTKQKLAEYLDYLYGSSINVYARGFGKYAMMIVRVKAINEKYLKEHILDKQIDLLHDLIFDYDFTENSFNEAIRLQIDSIKRNNDNPVNFTMNTLLKKCTYGTPGYASYYDDIDYLKSLTLNDLKDFYENFLKQSDTEIVFSGDMNQELVNKSIRKRFRDSDCYFENASFLLDKSRLEIEILTKKMPQSCLAQFYTFGIDVTNIKEYNAFIIGCDILGGNPTSLLFREIREKNSLCYSISSMMASTYDGMVILTSIAKDKIEEVRKLIDIQIDKIKQGEFSEELLENSRKMRRNSLISIDDTLGGKASYDLDNIMFNVDVSIDELLEITNSITKQDVIKSFQNVKFITEVILQGVNHD